MIARTVVVLAAASLVALGCKARSEQSEPTPPAVDDKSAGTDEKSADEGWTPKPVGGGPAPSIEPTPTPAPAPAPAAKPKPSKAPPATAPSATPSAAPSGSAPAPWQWPPSMPTWPWGTGSDAGPKTAPSAAPSANPPVVPWPWPQQQ